MLPLRLLACVAALAAAPASAASDVAKAAEPVALTFDWGDSFRARVESTRTRERVPAEPGNLAPDTKTSYLLDARRQADGSYIVKSLDPQIDVTASDAAALPTLDARSLEALTALEATLLISPDGDFTGIEGYEALRAWAEQFIVNSSPAITDPAQREKMRAFLDQVLSPEAVAMYSRQIWNAAIGAWTGATLEFGESLELRQPQRLPMFGNASAAMVTTFTAVERLPCPVEPAAKARECVRLRMTTSYDPAEMAQIITALIQRLAPADKPVPDGALTNLSIDSTIDVITEPGSLKPHHLLIRKVSAVTVQEGGQPKSVTQTETREVRYIHLD
jgi:hypothetical protein